MFVMGRVCKRREVGGCYDTRDFFSPLQQYVYFVYIGMTVKLA